MSTKTALLIIDVQQGMFEEPLFQPEKVITNVQSLITTARNNKIPIIYIQHNASNPDDLLHPDQPGHIIHPEVAPHPDDTVVQKHEPDSFQATDLDKVLKDKGINHLVIAGLQTELCVDTTCRAAYSRGYDVTLVGDAHSTFDSTFLMAEDIIKHHNIALGGWFAKVKPTAEIVFEA